ncbi:MAG TPA: PIN domain-containing protein [Bryobacteraceae bacterium]|nr:PIN domain-containing protein [Bryobacteraceae bacterium]
MEHVTEAELIERGQGPDPERPLVFLDTSVIMGYLRGEPSAAPVFSAEASGRIRFAVNPIVLQELLLAADAVGLSEFAGIRDHLRVLPIDYEKVEALVPRVRALRNRLAHSNNILILSSASVCDFLVTRDAGIKTLVTAEKPNVVTPEEFVTYLRAA